MQKVSYILLGLIALSCFGCTKSEGIQQISAENEQITVETLQLITEEITQEVTQTQASTAVETEKTSDKEKTCTIENITTTSETAKESIWQGKTAEVQEESTDIYYGITGYDVEALKKWHDLQEKDAYELIRNVLLGEQIFYYNGDGLGNNAGYTDMSELLEIVFEKKADTSKWQMMFVDLDGQDAVKECVLRTDSERHNVLMFHYSSGEVYVSENTFRDCMVVYANGIVEGSSSASNTYWDKIYFERGTKAVHMNVAGWNHCKLNVTSLNPKEYSTVPMGSRTEAWITVDGVLTEVPEDVFGNWLKENDFPGEAAPVYDFTEENILKYIVK